MKLIDLFIMAALTPSERLEDMPKRIRVRVAQSEKLHYDSPDWRYYVRPHDVPEYLHEDPDHPGQGLPDSSRFLRSEWYLFSAKALNAEVEILDNRKEINEYWEDAPEEIKPFDEVAKEMYSVELGPSYFRSSTSVSENDRRKERTPRPKEIIIADIDYYEILPDGTMKTKFTWGEAMGIEKKTNGKWRVLTQAEWFAITAAFGKNEAGEVTGETLAKNLNLTTDENGYGYYWSSTPSSYTNARYLRFSSTRVSPQANGNKTYGLSVRCVASR